MSTVALPFTIPKIVRRKVRSLRWLVRGYVLLEGIATVVILLCIAFWLTLFLDWYFEPSTTLRMLMGLGITAGLAFVSWKALFSRLFARLSDSSLALLVERTFPHIEQSLVTTIQGEHQSKAFSQTQNELFEHTSAEASQKLSQVELSQVFRYRPLILKAILAILLVGSLVGFALLQAEAFEFFLQRVQLSDVPWPRKVELTVVGFDEVDGKRTMNVARDDNFNLDVLASLQEGHIAPPEVEIRYRLPDGRRGRDSMTQVGDAASGNGDVQDFQYEFKNLAADISFDVIGGDDRIRDLHLHVVERPQIVKTELECAFPDYLQRFPQAIPFSGRVEIPQGTSSVCLVEINKPLREVQVYDSVTKEELIAELSSDNPRRFSIPLDMAQADRVLLLDVHDTDGVSNREPYRLMVSVIPDEIPEVSVQLRGIGTAVTPQATIPLVGTIRDDYAVTSAWIEGQTDKLEPQRRKLSTSAYSGRENTELGRLDLAETSEHSQQRALPLEPGQQLTLSVKAQDAYDLQSEPHVGSSQRFVLDVVTESQLRSLLEKRELGLRQRFEAIHEKMIATHDLLTRIEIKPQSTEDEPLENEEVNLRRERDKLRVSGALQNITQLTFETLGVAEGFEDIVVELQNNRIDTEELTERLQNNIAAPLHEIADKLMSELESQLQELPAVIDSGDEKSRVQSAAIIQSDVVIEAMQRILDRMLELESYNELVELLRGIVAEQKDLNEATRIKQLEKLRSLLDDE
ncbi:DUF4175 domain-containing protein [Bythopirellula polymerisocia]|nr:DUF4175 domain-containing protein [Bythopirellula polymerisocia]